MTRSISSTARAAMYASNTEEVFALLIEIENESDPLDPILFSLSHATITSTAHDGATSRDYPAGYFQIELPGESADHIDTVRIAIDNVDQRVVVAARNATRPPRVRMWVVLESSPNQVEAGPFRFRLESVTYDARVVRGELSYEDVVNRRWPQHDFTPSVAPGLH